MAFYDLSHLSQPQDQAVKGPIQDDEALFLFALIRTIRARRILEFGGLSGYSATNFCRSIGDKGAVYTVDINPVQKVADNHIVIQKSCDEIVPADIEFAPVDLIFFDCHRLENQWLAFIKLLREKMIHDDTIICCHDTGLHPTDVCGRDQKVGERYLHQTAERELVNRFAEQGWMAISFHCDAGDDDLPFRNGVTVLKRFARLRC